MKHSNLTVSLTHNETRNGLVYMAISLIALPWLLSEGNAYLANPLSQGKINFIYYFLNFGFMVWICRKFLGQSLNYALKIPFPVIWYGILGYLGAKALGEILAELESGKGEQVIVKTVETDDQMSMLDLRGQDICAALEKITLETLTPIEAMNELYRLKKMLN